MGVVPGLPLSLLSLLISIILVALLGVVVSKIHDNIYKTTLIVIVVLLMIITAWVCNSRSGMIASFSGGLFILLLRKENSKKWLIWGVTLLVFAALLYFIRPESSRGRIFIWRVCLNMIKDNPKGLGINGMSNAYMLYQADYFENNPDSLFIPNATDITIAYNEFFRIAVNFGIAGLILFLALIANVLITKSDNGKNDLFKALLISYLSFSLFSFPFANLYTWSLFPISLFILKKKIFSKVINFICILCLIGGLLFFSEEHKLQKQIEYQYINGFDDEWLLSMLNCSNFFLFYPALTDMILQCDSFQNNRFYEKFVDKAVLFMPSTDSYCRKAELLIRKNRHREAIPYLNKAQNMVPQKLRPRYMEFLIYYENGDMPNAIRKGNEILSLDYKIESSNAILILDDVKSKMASIELLLN